MTKEKPKTEEPFDDHIDDHVDKEIEDCFRKKSQSVFSYLLVLVQVKLEVSSIPLPS